MSPRRPYIRPVCRCGGRAELRRRRIFGVWRAAWQCAVPSCGKNLRVSPASPPVDIMALPAYLWRRKSKPNAKRRGYQAFLKTRAWQDQRKRVLARDRYRCKLKLWGCTGRATEAHHTSYEHGLEATPDADLVAACRGCNRLERERRITRRVLGG